MSFVSKPVKGLNRLISTTQFIISRRIVFLLPPTAAELIIQLMIPAPQAISTAVLTVPIITLPRESK